MTLTPVTAAEVSAAATDERDETTARPRWWTRLAVGLAAGVAASVILGVVARLQMRAAALAAGSETTFSWIATGMICVAFAMFLMPGALLAALRHGRGRSLLLWVGGLGFCLPVTGTAMTDLQSTGELTTLQWVGAYAAIAGIYLCALAIPVVTLRLIRLGLSLTTRR